MESEELELTGEKAFRVAEVLASGTCFNVLQLLATEKLDVSTTAHRLGFSEAYISEEVSKLESLGLIKIGYTRGKRGIRKVCELAYKKIILVIAP